MILYLDPFMGIAGDMTVSALVDLGADPGAVASALDALGMGDLRFRFEEVRRQGVRATLGTVSYPGENPHRHLDDILALLDSPGVSPRVKGAASDIFRRLGTAEAAVHGCAPDEVHFHEVGAADSIADIVGTCAAWESLGCPPVECGPLNLGAGFTTMEHGTFPVPPPAVVELLKGVPTFSFGPPIERTTPTGAALAMGLSRRFGARPAGSILSAGYGAGTRDTPGAPNVLRVLTLAEDAREGFVGVVEANLDDMTPEYLAGALETLRGTGAKEVFVTPVQGKKHRPGWVVTVLCAPGEVTKFASVLFETTTTAGVRFRCEERLELPREEIRMDTPWGPARVKRLTTPSGSARHHAEWDDVETLASRAGVAPLEMNARILALLAGRMNESR